VWPDDVINRETKSTAALLTRRAPDLGSSLRASGRVAAPQFT
jgi:hypothetical protein